MTTAKKSASLTKLWVPVVLAVGILFGLALSLNVPPAFQGRFGPVPFDPPLQIHIILAAVQVVLLVALLVLYIRSYAQTRANFALGLVIVLGALFLHSLFSNPFVIGLVGRVPFGPGYFGLFPDLFMIAAYTIFLYLSLE